MEFRNNRPNNVLFIFFFCISLLSATFSIDRRINCTIYSGPADTESLNLAHIEAAGIQDVVHYLWSTYKVPSVIVARTTIDTNLVINFEKLKSMERGALVFSKEPLAYTGLTILELFENSYSGETSNLDDPFSEMALGLEFFQWSDIKNSTFSCNELSASLHLESSSKSEDDIDSENGIFRIEFSVSGNEESVADFPHLVYTGNSTQVKIAFDGFHTQLNSSRTRYGMKIKSFLPQSTNCSDTDCKAVVKDSISDEFSPGVFSDVNLITPCSLEDNNKGAFISWRPVAYTGKEPTVANSSDANLVGSCPRSSDSSVGSIAELFFEDPGVPSNVFNMTFGTVGAGFYSKTNYTEWSLMLGTGTAVQGKLSVAAIVLLIIAVGGLGLSFLLVAAFYAVRYFRQRDDDSLLTN